MAPPEFGPHLLNDLGAAARGAGWERLGAVVDHACSDRRLTCMLLLHVLLGRGVAVLCQDGFDSRFTQKITKVILITQLSRDGKNEKQTGKNASIIRKLAMLMT